MEWIYLTVAIISEVVATLSLKYSSTHNSSIATVITAVGYLISFTLVWFAVKKIDISIAYAIWAGVGISLVSIASWLIFKEVMSFQKVLFIAMIVVGVAGLKYID